ncbi:MAG: AraC family transcriptional regulator [Acidimicrobiales bacterium]|nr:AraC family transcriptional regulator [Acidimicrobiales bacterium]
MGEAEPNPDPLHRWNIATPARPRLPGVSMSGFADRTVSPLDLGVVPYPAVTLAVDLSDDLEVVDEATGRGDGGAVSFGPGSNAVRVRGRSVEGLQVRMSPVVAHAVLGPGAAIDGGLVSLEDLWGRDAHRFREQLRDAPTWDDRFAIAETAIARRVEIGRAVDPELVHTWDRMVGSGGRVRVGRVAEELGWGRKRLWSRFRSQLGLTPKQAARLIRFDRAVHRLAAGHGAATVAAEGGYADQPHLNREVKAFTGLTPSAVALAPWLAVDDVAWAPPHPATS